jgi:uncharacterized protein YndB with AHSA1/START domain
MPDILHDLPIKALPGRVFEAVSTPAGLDRWWTKRSSGEALEGSRFRLHFGSEYDWRARVTRCVAGSVFELEFERADVDWRGTQVGFELEPRDASTWLRFHHRGWHEANEHYRISSNCWAMYLRILRRYLEHGETVIYEKRLDV